MPKQHVISEDLSGRKKYKDQRLQKGQTKSGQSRSANKDESGISLSLAQSAMQKLKLITSATENSVQQCFDLLENLSVTTSNFTEQSE